MEPVRSLRSRSYSRQQRANCFVIGALLSALFTVAPFRIRADNIFFWRIFLLGAFVNLKVSATADNCPIQVSSIGIATVFGVLISGRRL